MIETTLTMMVQAVVDLPDQVKITIAEEERGTVFHVRVHPSDIPKVIGKGGQGANALRAWLRAAGQRNGISRSYLNIVNELRDVPLLAPADQATPI